MISYQGNVNQNQNKIQAYLSLFKCSGEKKTHLCLCRNKRIIRECYQKIRCLIFTAMISIIHSGNTSNQAKQRVLDFYAFYSYFILSLNIHLVPHGDVNLDLLKLWTEKCYCLNTVLLKDQLCSFVFYPLDNFVILMKCTFISFLLHFYIKNILLKFLWAK